MFIVEQGDTEDVKSRHKGKLETEAYLKQIGIPFTSIRPTYIYGPMNYNPLGIIIFQTNACSGSHVNVIHRGVFLRSPQRRKESLYPGSRTGTITRSMYHIYSIYSLLIQCIGFLHVYVYV